MALFGPVMDCNGYNPLTGQCASKTIPSSVPANMIDAYMAGQYTPATVPNVTTPQTATGGIHDYINRALSAIDSIDPTAPVNGGAGAGGVIGNSIDSATKAANQVTTGTSSLLGILTDVPRVGTLLVGGLMIGAGLFALAGNSRVIQLAKA